MMSTRMTPRAPGHPSCFGILHHHPLSTLPWSLSSAPDLCALVYFSAQGVTTRLFLVASQVLGASKAGPCQLWPRSLILLPWGARLLRMRYLEVLKASGALPGNLLEMQSIGTTQDLRNSKFWSEAQ